MTVLDPKTITRLLHGVRNGEEGAVDSLLPLVYGELLELSRRIFSTERKGHTLQPTAVIHEAWLKLVAHLDRVGDRTHFFAVASQAMRQVLADHARARSRRKRGGGHAGVTLEQQSPPARRDDRIDLIDLHDSLCRLEALNARHARVVELRILGGLTIAETAQVLGVSHTTVEEDWFTAKGWLRTQFASGR